jgi:predicted phosphohydrolase
MMTVMVMTVMTDSPRVFAISDLHLPGGSDNKSMDLFGARWQAHFHQIKEDWMSRVGDEDIVLIPGDISWAMHLEDAREDLDAIGSLPGIKVLIKGNHDYWWNSISRVRAALPARMYALQNDAVRLNGLVFCGTRGWNLPGSETVDPEDQKIYQRELARLELSLKEGRRQDPSGPLTALCHYPPLSGFGEDTPVTALLQRYGVRDAVYGHLHGFACASGFTGTKKGVRYWFASCDCVDFKLLQLEEEPSAFTL